MHLAPLQCHLMMHHYGLLMSTLSGFVYLLHIQLNQLFGVVIDDLTSICDLYKVLTNFF